MNTYENIKKYRKQRKMTQQQLAELTGYNDRSSIAKIESGLVDISQSKLETFAKVLHVTPGELMGNTENIVDDNPSYYLDPDAAAFAQEISESPGLRALFSAARDVKEEDLRFMVEMAERFKKESGE